MKKLSDLYESHMSFWSWLVGGLDPWNPPQPAPRQPVHPEIFDAIRRTTKWTRNASKALHSNT